MKKLYFILITSLFLAACSKENNENTFEINGQFVDNDIECSSISIEPNCIKFVSFIDKELYLLYEGDIMLKGNYAINGNRITTTNVDNYIGDISFKIINNKTLVRIEDGAIFIKENN